MALNLPDPNKTPGDAGHTSDTNLIIEAINTLKSEVDGIPAGEKGDKGDPGDPGAAGAAATVYVAGTITTQPGVQAAVTSSGTPQNVALTFYIPRGETGPAGATGAQGAIGPVGPQGPEGEGVAPGGSAGYVLAKASNDDYDTEWIPAGAAPPVSSVDGRTGDVTLTDLYDAAGSAASAQSAAESYADGLASNYDPAGAAASAQSAAESYADGLASNYDPAGAAASAQSAAESYADGLASNYDPAGAASAVAGDLSAHEGASTTVHGISNTADLVYTNDARLTDARTPTAHASSHGVAGGDAITIAQSQVTDLSTDLGAKVPKSVVDAKGDLIVGSGADAVARLAVSGNNGWVLTEDSAATNGVKWAVAAAPVDDPYPTVMFLGGM